MKIRGLSDWLAFVDDIQSKATDTLVDMGYDADALPMMAMFYNTGATHAEFVSGKGDPERKRAAFSTLVICGQIRDAAATLSENPDQSAGILSALAYRLHMVASGLHSDTLRAAFLSREQQDRGKAGAKKRWSGKEAATFAIRKLARERDGWGEPLQPKELWPMMFSELDFLNLDPIDHGTKYSYNGGTLTYDAFRRRIQRERGNKRG